MPQWAKSLPRPLKATNATYWRWAESTGFGALRCDLTASLRILKSKSFCFPNPPTHTMWDFVSFSCVSQRSMWEGTVEKVNLPRQGQRLQNAEDESKPSVVPLEEKWYGYRYVCDKRHTPKRLRKIKIHTYPKGRTQGKRNAQLERERKLYLMNTMTMITGRGRNCKDIILDKLTTTHQTAVIRFCGYHSNQMHPSFQSTEATRAPVFGRGVQIPVKWNWPIRIHAD